MRVKMRQAAALVADSVAAGGDFTRDAWRDAGAVLALSALAGAVGFVADHADLPHDLAHALHWVGWGGLALVFAPKLGALYRSALGGPALRDLGPGGLQWKRIEWRLLGTSVSLFAFAVIVLLPLMALMMVTLAVLRPLGVVNLGPLGPLGIGFLLTAPVFVGLAALAFTALARLAVTLPAEAAEAQPRFARGWFVTEGASLATAWVAAATFLAPLFALLLVQIALDWLEAGDGGSFGGRAWPLTDAVAAGLVLGAFTEFLAAPFCVGAFADLYLTLAPAQAATADAVASKAATKTVESAATGTGASEAQTDLTPVVLPEGVSEPRKIEIEARSDGDADDATDAATSAKPEPDEPAAPKPRLRLVHSVDLAPIPWRPLAPEGLAREAQASRLESQEP